MRPADRPICPACGRQPKRCYDCGHCTYELCDEDSDWPTARLLLTPQPPDTLGAGWSEVDLDALMRSAHRDWSKEHNDSPVLIPSPLAVSGGPGETTWSVTVTHDTETSGPT